MDQHRFDQLARALAGGASRRRLVRGLVGGAAAGLLAVGRGGRATAQEFSIPLGGACIDSNQCDQTGGCGLPAAIICGDNGIAEDGPLTCCVGEGTLCEADSQCCGSLLCAGLTAEVCGTCQGAPTGGDLAPGAVCTATSQCSQAGGATVCASNGYTTDAALHCCRNEGGACADTVLSADCCAAFLCVAGVCQPVDAGDGGGLAPGATCAATSECSQAGGPAICADNGIADDGALNCCLLEVSACTSDNECCAGLVCDDNFIAADGALTCCGFSGSACGSDAACCSTLLCVDGTCQALA